MAEVSNLSVAIVGSGGAGALTTGNLLLEAARRRPCFAWATVRSAAWATTST